MWILLSKKHLVLLTCCDMHRHYIYNMIFEVLTSININPLNPELNPICYLLALLGAHHFLHVSRIRVKILTL